MLLKCHLVHQSQPPTPIPSFPKKKIPRKPLLALGIACVITQIDNLVKTETSLYRYRRSRSCDRSSFTVYDPAGLDGLEYDTYIVAAPAAATDEVVIVDYAGISEGAIADNVYKMGNKLYGLKVPAGTIARARRLALHDKYWIGEDNFDTEPTVGKFATAEAGEFTHKAAASLPGSGFAVKVLIKEDLTTGMKSNGSIYLVEVVQL